MAGTDLFRHIRAMMWTTLPAWLLAMIGFSILGVGLEGTADPGSVAVITSIIENEFDPGAIHLLVPAIVAVMVGFRMPALPTLLVGALLGAVLAGVRGASMPEVLASAMSGFAPKTGSAEVDELLARGGMQSMANTVLLVLCAMSFGGIMERTGQLKTLASKTLAAANSTGSLITATILTALGVNILAADQYLAIVIPGRMYAAEYRERGLDPSNLSRALEDGGTITSPLVPWNTCGAFMATTLGVGTIAYLPYCFLNLINPIIGMLLGFTGWKIIKAPTDGS
jgi:NhaC family Na+:H+ antiporter